MAKTFFLVLIAAIVGGSGHVLLSKGMKTVGDLTQADSGRLGEMLRLVAGNPWVWLGILLQAMFFFAYLALLSRADITVVLPLTAVDYVVVTLLAQQLLGEVITPLRWAGIGFVAAGVLMIART